MGSAPLDVDECVRRRCAWPQLPPAVRQLLGNSQKEYQRYIYEFSIKNQLRYRGNLVRSVKRDERHYYESVIQCSIRKLMLFPYHLADMVVKGLRITPFSYYREVVGFIMNLEKSYDTLPNFTAADCLRLLGIGRNEYIELMNKSKSRSRSWKVSNFNSSIQSLLPAFPCTPPVQPWWRLELGYVLEDDIKMLNNDECDLIDILIDQGSQTLGTLPYSVVQSLYKKGLVYIDVPITGVDRVRVPPLQGFVMNRVMGDFFETLLYKIFVSIDENTTVSDLSSVLQVDVELVKQAVSLYCRLGFAQKLDIPVIKNLHPSWSNLTPVKIVRPITPLTYDPAMQTSSLEMEPVLTNLPITSPKEERTIIPSVYKDSTSDDKKIPRFAFLFDSTLTAYLMMGNLSPDLKNHAVTMFEVGKLCDESIDSFLEELDKIGWQDIEGEAKRYWTHALVLKSALRILAPLRPLDLVRCESLQSLDAATVARLLNNKYKLLATMAPLSRDVRPPLGAPHTPPLLGPTPPEINSLWFKLYIYHITGYGPPTLLLTKGTVIKNLPRLFLGFSRLLISSWQHEAVVLSTCNFLAINETLKYSPVMIQAYGVRDVATTRLISFPPPEDPESEKALLWQHSALNRLKLKIDVDHSCGYITMIDIGVPDWGIDEISKDVTLKRQFTALKSRSKTDDLKSKLNIDVVNITEKSSDHSICDLNENEFNSSDDDKLKQAIEEKLLNNIGIEKQLQSPNESHFALTPNDSPANGFTSVDCSNILCQELDQLEKQGCLLEFTSDSDEGKINKSKSESIKNLLLEESLMSPLDENISMFAQLCVNNENKTSSVYGSLENIPDCSENIESAELKNFKKEQWTILECHMGIPLFDEEINRDVCNSIVNKLSKSDSLKKLADSNVLLSSDLLKFISQCQYFPGEDMEIKKRGPLVPLPKKNLVFENGKICLWMGK